MHLRHGLARWWVLLGICAAAIAWLVVGGLASNIVYFRTASEAQADRVHDATHVFRLAGAVVPNSVQAVADGVDFQLTDGHVTIPVHHRGDPPELFRPGAPVVVEGHWDSPASSAFFASDRILIKHGSEYSPPPVPGQNAPANAGQANATQAARR
ncbi:MAG: cytochrome c-type biosis protein CcmE [Frankiaceae bacterium]|nr:cytochrome c-type biosis protein CcmE [Frankiaceae bacterium]